ncbi:50S ribosomal protein L11 methyltransferase [Flagellimonas sp. DF-77]|uniref:50S ribosomal protein L11 methyltransferase n=1 Tax=Flagellimonas algarum TaxID=3230298 RepID=UPI003394F8E6
MDYLEFRFQLDPVEPTTGIVIAHLAEIGFESFVENEEGLLAYITEPQFDVARFDALPIFENSGFKLQWSRKTIQQQNWNAEWEKQFEPIHVGDSCTVRAPFHGSFGKRFEIVIMPKMSFGTGHHETTFMMLAQMLEIDFLGKRVLDMGTGTGVLAIMAEMRGAQTVDAIDIDAWSYENALENVERNACKKIKVYQGDASTLSQSRYDIILANINKNILLQDIPTYIEHMERPGMLLLSGFYENDVVDLNSLCQNLGGEFRKKMEKNDWVAAKYVF